MAAEETHSGPEDPAAEVLDRLPQRRPASIYDVAYQYAILDWYVTVTSGDLDFDLKPEHLTFMSPMEKEDLYGEEDNAIVVYVDLTNPEDPQLRENQPVKIETLSKADRYRLGHSYPTNKTSSMTDYSVTTHKSADAHHLAGKRDDSWGTANVQDRFTRWATSDAAKRVSERGNVENAWIIDALAALGADEEEMNRVQEAFLDLVNHDEEREFEVFVTIRVRLPGDDSYRFPGEVPALNEVMIEQKAERFENIAVENAAEEGVGFVTGEKGRVTGGSAGVFGMYAKKQREHFANLSPDGSDAWRSRPVIRDTSAALATANSVFDQFFQGLGNSRRLYVLPYLGAHPETLSTDDVAWFADSVFDRFRTSPESFQSVASSVFYERDGDSDESQGLFADPDDDAFEWVRIATVFYVSGNPPRVYFERLDVDQYRPRELARTHSDVLSTPEFDGTAIFASSVEHSESPLLNREANLAQMVLFGSYFDWTTEPTRSSREASDEPKAGDIDDVRARRLRQFLTNEEVSLSPLYEEYLHKIVQDQRDRFDEDDYAVPTREIVEQYAQLRALTEIGAVQKPNQESGSPPGGHSIHNFATVTNTDHNTDYESRSNRLDAFIERHEVLTDSHPAQAVFLLGGLVGRISAYQRRNNVSSTLVRRYPIDYLTKQSVKEVTNEVLQMNNTYVESDSDLPSTYNARYIDRLPDLMLSSNPSEWKFNQNELQWLYALGIAYGSNDTQIQNGDQQ